MSNFGPMPQTVICPSCKVCVTTRTQTHPGSSGRNDCLKIFTILCSCFLICGLCAADDSDDDCGPDCIYIGDPCAGGSRSGVDHYCPQCNCLIGRYNN